MLLGLQIGLAIVAEIFVVIVIGAGPKSPFNGLVAVLVSVASVVLLLAFALRKASVSWRQALPFKRFSLLLLPALAIATAGLSILLSECNNALQWFVPVPAWLLDMMKVSFGGPLATIIAVVVVVPVAEEVFFRGLILGRLLERYRARTAILVSAGLFMLVHLNPYQFPIALTIGILAGWIYVQTHSLWPCMITHGLLNLGPALVATSLLPQKIEGYCQLVETESVVPFQPLWFDALGAALAVMGLLGLYWTFRSLRALSPQVNA